jgi:tRNA modification GTPase
MTDDTIVAIATPVGMGGIGIIKISGEKALDIATRVFRPRNASPPLKSHFLYYGEIFDPQKKCAVDEVLLSFMAKPRSYTREDVVEINCHGGYLALQETLALILKAGARLAEPGEFTKRAFLSGRIDLAQAEAVADLIESKTSLSLQHTSSQLKGSLSREIHGLKDMLVDLLSALEASIDFPEEDLELAPSSQLVDQTDRLLSRIETLLCTYEEGKLYREGASTIIAGKPNAGKSSLFNVLLEEERAIVTPVPGTTRDFIEEFVAVKGLPLKIIDTAGLRDPSDSIEGIGVKRTKEKLAQADLVLLVIDSSVALDDHDRSLFSDLNGKRVVVVENKNDLPGKVSHGTVQGLFPESRVVSISALYKKGIEELKETIFSSLTAEATSISSPLLISNLRHKRALEKTLEAIQRAREGLQKKIPPEFTATDFQAALHSLGEITGHTTTEEILNQIFSRFCIGK